MELQTTERYARLVEDAWRAALPTDSEIRSARRRLHGKALLIGLIVAGSYFVLVLSDATAVLRIAAAAVLTFGLVATGTGVMHDANHGSFSRHRWLNRSLAYTSDALGASSWLWRIQHNQLHHGNTNVVGFDAYLELAPWARLAPGQPWHPRYRWQHLYIWPLYGFLTIKNLLVSDFLSLRTGRIGEQSIQRRVTARVLAQVTLGKLAHVAWAVVVPLLFNPWQTVLAFYAICSWVVGFVLAVIFQLAHCVESAELCEPDTPRRGENHAAHQLRTTADIAPTPGVGPVFHWLAGGLDYQIEHHLAPGLPHTIYPQVARRFRAGCARAGVVYHLHRGLGAALASHWRQLRVMGRPVGPSAVSKSIAGSHG
jgi:linoleoyl-CoA desaturase